MVLAFLAVKLRWLCVSIFDVRCHLRLSAVTPRDGAMPLRLCVSALFIAMSAMALW
jgi:hypothetical protein